jgi:hypothetical protein
MLQVIEVAGQLGLQGPDRRPVFGEPDCNVIRKWEFALPQIT